MALLLSLPLTACAARGRLLDVERREDHLTAGDLLETTKPSAAEAPAIRGISNDGVALTKLSEGWVPHLYLDTARYCTIGYGHLVKRAPCNGGESPEFLAGITEPRGETILVSDLAGARITVSDTVTVPLLDGQYAALCDFVFNVGSSNFRTSTLLKVVNSNALDQVAGQFRRWILAGGKVQAGLKTRREREIALFFNGLPTPSIASIVEPFSPVDIRKGETGSR